MSTGVKHQRGEVWLVDLGLAAKVRPALILSVSVLDHERALVTLVPHTTSDRKTRFEAVIPTRFLREGAFDTQSLVTIPHAKLVRRLGKLGLPEIALVEAKVRLWLGLSSDS